ncbi:MAG: transcriptional regulator BetI [Notoacmeibacter sp.]|nr:transcriptional regulator BetI [Notoacmeibacter sp.]
MPKIGMEPIRRKSLIEAAIAAIQARGSLDVTMSDIARRAGVSQGLAHHYFGSKEELIVSAMRYLLTEFGQSVRTRLNAARTPRERISAIIEASLASEQFQPGIVSAWLVFYNHAQSSSAARRLLNVYHKRLNSNLISALKPIAGPLAPEIAEGVASLIDGLYIREALSPQGRQPIAPRALVERYVDRMTSEEQSGGG